jgi:hypothetical protein
MSVPTTEWMIPSGINSGWFLGGDRIFWRKIEIFHTKYPKNVRASLRWYHSLGRVDTCAGKLLIPESIIHSVDTCAGRLLIPEGIQGRIQDFKLGEAHLKKLGRAKGGANIFGVFRVKNLDFTPKNPVPPRNHPLLIPPLDTLGD